ncbi:MAG: ribonuclease H-like domain-containing protein [Myxococcales bacterium]|nr:ribonuclease H-like domain-containing protein [Myxococcales bacterium]
MRLVDRVRRELTGGRDAREPAASSSLASSSASASATAAHERPTAHQRRIAQLRRAIERMESRDRSPLPQPLEPMEVAPPKPSAAALAQRLTRILGVDGARGAARSPDTPSPDTMAPRAAVVLPGSMTPPEAEPPPEDELPSEPMPASVDARGLRYLARFEPAPASRRALGVELPGAEALAALQALLAINRAWRRQRGDDPTALTRDEGAAGAAISPDEILFIDTETTGLSRSAGTLAFLIGVGRFERDALVVEQLLLRDPGDEPRALGRLAELLARARLVVSYNGRSFDLPLLATRAMLSRTPLPLGYEHVDLLHYCRRLFSARTTNRRLKTMELEVLGFDRGADIDGALAPAIYSAFLAAQREARGGGAPLGPSPMGAVMRHNCVDVASMAPLLWRVARAVAQPRRFAEDAEELYAIGTLHEQMSSKARRSLPQFAADDRSAASEMSSNASLSLRAGDAYRRGLELSTRAGTRRALLVALARLHRRSGDRRAAREVWERFRREFPDANMAWVELAKHHEHHEKSLHEALACAEAAPSRSPEVQHRIARLRRRIDSAP